MSAEVMNLEQASRIVGGCGGKVFIRNMHRALGMMAWTNTPEENERREAAGIVLRNWKKHLAHQQRLLDERHAKRRS